MIGYRIRYGSSPSNLPELVDVTGASVSSYVIQRLAKGTHYFTVSTLGEGGVASDPSNPAAVTIP